MGCFDWLLPVEGRLPGFLRQAEWWLPVMDVMCLPDGGLVAFGRVNQGFVSVGDALILRRRDGSTAETVVLAMERFRKTIDFAREGDNIGLLLSGVPDARIAMGDVLLKEKAT